jgi:hypothetical protein
MSGVIAVFQVDVPRALPIFRNPFGPGPPDEVAEENHSGERGSTSRRKSGKGIQTHNISGSLSCQYVFP